jgi:hypothetical protein
MVEVEVPVVDGVNFLLGERRIVLSRKVMGNTVRIDGEAVTWKDGGRFLKNVVGWQRDGKGLGLCPRPNFVSGCLPGVSYECVNARCSGQVREWLGGGPNVGAQLPLGGFFGSDDERTSGPPKGKGEQDQQRVRNLQPVTEY